MGSVGTRRLEGTVDLRGVREEVADTAGVAPLVVVPGDELDEVLVERDAGLRVEDRRVVVAEEVGRDDLVVGVADDALVRRLGRLLDRLLDLVVGRALLEADDEVDDIIQEISILAGLNSPYVTKYTLESKVQKIIKSNLTYVCICAHVL